MSTKLVLMTSAVWAILAPGTTLCPVAVYRHGLHHGITTVGRMRPTVGNHRQIHQDGTLHSTPRKVGVRPNEDIRPGSMEIPQIAY